MCSWREKPNATSQHETRLLLSMWFSVGLPGLPPFGAVPAWPSAFEAMVTMMMIMMLYPLVTALVCCAAPACSPSQ